MKYFFFFSQGQSKTLLNAFIYFSKEIINAAPNIQVDIQLASFSLWPIVVAVTIISVQHVIKCNSFGRTGTLANTNFLFTNNEQGKQ